MKKLTEIGIMAVLCVLFVIPVFAEEGSYKYYAADTAPVLRIRYIGTSTVLYANNATTSTVTVDGAATTITYGAMSADEAGVLQGDIKAVDAGLDVELAAALSADAVDGLVIATTSFTLEPGVWYEVTPWDTSGVVRYDAVAWGGEEYGVRNKLTGIYGLPTGTGAVTISAYFDGTLVHTMSYPTTWPTGQTTNVADIHEELVLLGGLYAGEKKIHLRAVRATTATTGGIGFVMTQY